MAVKLGQITLLRLVQVLPFVISQLAIATEPHQEPLSDLGEQAVYDDGINPISYTDGNWDDLLVKTSLFTVQGAESPEDPAVRQFLGIPYAKAPVGKLRFRPPVTREATNEVINATRHGPSCFQHSPINSRRSLFSEHLPGFSPTESQAEDCLTLDIWAPRQKQRPSDRSASAGKSAVLIWIHGGALMTGGSSTPYERGTRLVADHEDVIVVSIK